MSGGKKKYPKKKTYSESEHRREVRDKTDEAVKRVMLICICAARDEFNLDENGTVRFADNMARYIKYESDGVLNLQSYSESLLNKTGIDLRLRRW